MKKVFKNLQIWGLALVLTLSFLPWSAEKAMAEEVGEEFHDYVADLKLDQTSSCLREEVTVEFLVDGDTTHFNVDKERVPDRVAPDGILKARYLGLDTPESTGSVEPYGEKAKKFTNSKLESATSIIIESDTENWDIDSTGGRVLVWVWYRTSENEDYRNLNLEILQEGLARNKGSSNTRYSNICMAACMQAQHFKLNIWSGEKDPDFYYGSALEVTLKELSLNKEAYKEKTVAFTGIITCLDGNNGFFVEDYDADASLHFGMFCYMGFGLDGTTRKILSIGNKVRIVGTVELFHDSWQISNLKGYNPFEPDNPENIKLIEKAEEGEELVYNEITGDIFDDNNLVEVNGVMQNPADWIYNQNLTAGETSKEIIYETRKVDKREVMLNTAVSMKNLMVKNITTTQTGGNSDGAMTLSCVDENGKTVKLRTGVFHDGRGKLITESRYKGKVIDVKGFFDSFNGRYQIQIVSPKFIEIHGEEKLRADAAKLDERILNIPKKVTDENYDVVKAEVAELRQYFDSLPEEEKFLVDNAKQIANAENRIKSYEQKKADEQNSSEGKETSESKESGGKGCGGSLASVGLSGIFMIAAAFIVYKKKR